MTLAPSSKLGPYEIVGAIGAGGMGEVYRARDTRLGRDVAIKVLAAAHVPAGIAVLQSPGQDLIHSRAGNDPELPDLGYARASHQPDTPAPMPP